MSLHHGLTDLCDNYFTDSCVLAWFQASSQASLRFCLWAPLTSNHVARARQDMPATAMTLPYLPTTFSELSCFVHDM